MKFSFQITKLTQTLIVIWSITIDTVAEWCQLKNSMPTTGLNFSLYQIQILTPTHSQTSWTSKEPSLTQPKFTVFSTHSTFSYGSVKTLILIFLMNCLTLTTNLDSNLQTGLKRDSFSLNLISKRLGFRIFIKPSKHVDFHRRFTLNWLSCLKRMSRGLKCKFKFKISVIKDYLLEDKTKGIDLNDVSKMINSTTVWPDMPY